MKTEVPTEGLGKGLGEGLGWDLFKDLAKDLLVRVVRADLHGDLYSPKTLNQGPKIAGRAKSRSANSGRERYASALGATRKNSGPGRIFRRAKN